MKPRPFLAFLMVCTIHQCDGGSEWPAAAGGGVKTGSSACEVAGTVYRISKELFGTVDHVLVTDGEAGYRYSSLAIPYYGIDLTNEAVGRARLPKGKRGGQAESWAFSTSGS